MSSRRSPFQFPLHRYNLEQRLRLQRWFPFALLAFTLFLYWRLFTLLFFWDDAPHFLNFSQHTFAEIWTNRNGYGYYRPLIFSFYRIAYHWWHWPPAYFYAVALGLHFVGALLIGQVARSLARRALAPPAAQEADISALLGAAASILFVTYPFSVITLGNVAAMMHPAVICLALTAIAAIFRYLESKRWQWLLLSMTSAFLAPFVHEYGVTVGAIVGLSIIAYQDKAAWRWRWLILSFPLLNLFFVSIWLSVPKSSPGLGWVGWDSLWSSITFFVQGFTYIFQPLTQRLVVRGWPELTTVWLVALPTLLAATILLWRWGQWRLWLLSVGWFALSIFPSIIGLPFSYIYPSMRLHSFPGVTGVLLLSAAAVSLAQFFSSQRWRVVVIVGMIGIGAAIPAAFVVRSLVLHQFALDPVRQMTAMVQQHPDEKHLLINALDWVSYRNAWYPLGHEGVEVMPNYVLPASVASINARRPAHIQDIVFPPLQEPLANYYYGVNREEWLTVNWEGLAPQILAADRVWVMSYTPQRIVVDDVGSITQHEVIAPATYLANFEGKIFLQGGEARSNGKNLHLTLDWKYLGPDPNATVFRHVVDCAGNLIGQGDGYVLGRAMPFSLIPPGAEIRDRRRIPLEALPNDGCSRTESRVEIGLFYPDGQRMQTLDATGALFEKLVVSLPIVEATEQNK